MIEADHFSDKRIVIKGLDITSKVKMNGKRKSDIGLIIFP